MSVAHSKPVSIHTPFAVKRAVSKRGYAKTFAARPVGSGAELISVEADLTRGLHAFSIVGLADKAVEEGT